MGLVRSAAVGDREQILDVVRAAFSGGGGDGQAEVDIVRATWRLGAAAENLELVATLMGSFRYCWEQAPG